MSEYIVRATVYHGTVKQEIVGMIVRCKDCKHRGEGDICFHQIWGPITFPKVPDDGFCKWGERREE